MTTLECSSLDMEILEKLALWYREPRNKGQAGALAGFFCCHLQHYCAQSVAIVM